MIIHAINYCPQCGCKLEQQERFGRLRPTCLQCNWVYFADPRVAVAVIVERENQILLVRRVFEQEKGLWTLPAGFVDAGEDPIVAAERECSEETGLQVKVSGLLDVVYGLEHPRGAHILIVYCADILGGELKPADDVDMVGFFSRNELPPLAFKTTRKILSNTKVLKKYYTEEK
ncbi:MAG: NUDIX hydrolase [Chloroflexi bacterium]|nr:NUDIX hydrolase [Chloroflexota bacterium]